MDAPETISLKTKMKAHWNTRDQIFNIKPEKANWLGISFFWGFTFSLMFTSLWIVIPDITYHDDDAAFPYKALVWWIFFQSVTNWVLCIVVDTSVGKYVSPPQAGSASVMQELPPDWRHCPICNVDVPPRAHHCKLCKTCILKRDHHCFFTGFCVGFYNQRRFIVFVFYIMVGSIYGVYLIFEFLNESIPINSSDGVSYIAFVALWQCVFGYLDVGHFLLILQMYFTLATMLASGGFFFWEMSVVYRGQTSNEAAKGIHRYRTDVLSHMSSVFGPFGFIHFILPLPIKQSGDGITWPRKTLKAN